MRGEEGGREKVRGELRERERERVDSDRLMRN